MKLLAILGTAVLLGFTIWKLTPTTATAASEANPKTNQTCLDKCEKEADKCEKDGNSKMVCQNEYDKCVLKCDKL